MRIYVVGYSSLHFEGITIELNRTLKPHDSPVIVCCTDKSGSLLASGGSDGSVKVWDIQGGFVTHNFHGHGGLISALCFFQMPEPQSNSIDSRKRKGKSNGLKGRNEGILSEKDVKQYYLASGAEDGKIKVWNLHERKNVCTLQSHYSVVRSLSYSSEQNIVVSGSRDKTLMIWDCKSWTLRSTISVLEEIEICGLLCQGSVIFSGGESGNLRLWRTFNGKEITKSAKDHEKRYGIVDVCYCATFQCLLCVHSDQSFTFYSTATLKSEAAVESITTLPIIHTLSGNYDEIIDFAHVGKDKSVLALATNVEHIRLISTKDANIHNWSNSKVSWMDDLGFGADVALLEGHKDIIITLDVDWSGSWLVTGAKDNTARLWSIDMASKSFECCAILSGHAEAISAVNIPKTTPPSNTFAFSDPLKFPPAYVLTGSQDHTIKRWDVSEYAKLSINSIRAKYTRKAHDKDINAIDINHNGLLFATASQDRTTKVWDVEEGEAIGVLRGHKRGVWSVKFSPKDTPIIAGSPGGSGMCKGFVLTGSGDRSIKVWSLSDYSCMLTLEGHTNSVLKVLWVNPPLSEPLSKRPVLASSAGGDGLVKVWDLSIGQIACTLDNHTDRVWALTNGPQEEESRASKIVSGGGDGVITFWVDKTHEATAAQATAETEKVKQEQRLQNLAQSGRVREAIVLALQLNHPARLLSLLNTTTENLTSKKDMDVLKSHTSPLDSVLSGLADEHIFALLLRLRDWNANVRTATVAQQVLWALVKGYPASRIINLVNRKDRKNVAFTDILNALKAYTKRHYQRLEGLIDECYLLEFTLHEMGTMPDSDIAHNRFQISSAAEIEKMMIE